MAPSLAHVIETAHALWPLAGAESWDAPGLIVGDPLAEVSAIHLAVDAVVETAEEAVDAGAQLLLVHHPLLLRGVTSVAEDRYKGAVIARLIRGDAHSSPRTPTPTSWPRAPPPCWPGRSACVTRDRSCRLRPIRARVSAGWARSPRA
ncbi:hypothetical protein GCM10025869_29050 [Homoserinibacter gongjuensis]|uniref:GTP cyclohydrolase 1 type 2 homolog n=1 Tax=Homoserinibacter gongjuensis TaxID=1162968 RepID=A0ABQ6K0R3_9MICO|nr:hypothetical protein GCM10025869_29050 [Homoserinibacter gongjuensis]